MTARDRTMVMGLLVAVLIGAFWFMALAPKRNTANQLSGEIKTERTTLQDAQASVTAGLAAQSGYAEDYATVARLGKAVPVQDDVPSLVYQLQTASQAAKVHFDDIELSGGAASASQTAAPSTPAAQVAAVGAAQKGTSTAPAATTAPAPATQTAASVLPPGASVGSAGFPTMPFDFYFQGSFFRLDDLLRKLNKFTSASDNAIRVGGRLLTVDGIALSPTDSNIHATAYLLPQDQGLTAGATPQAPAAATTAASTTTSSNTAPPVAVLPGVGR